MGSLQQFVDADFEQHYFTLYEDEAHHDQLRAMCAFDLVGNNTDRKSGHCLLGLDGRIRGIDHGLMFHHEFKLRTVIWEFGGEAVPPDLLEAVDALADAGAARSAWPRCSTPSSGTPSGPALEPSCERAASRSTRPAGATPGRSCEAEDGRAPRRDRSSPTARRWLAVERHHLRRRSDDDGPAGGRATPGTARRGSGG